MKEFSPFDPDDYRVLLIKLTCCIYVCVYLRGGEVVSPTGES